MDRDELAKYLIEARIAGPVRTPREHNLANYRLLADRDPDYTFGLDFQGTWSFPEILALMAQRCGVEPDPGYDNGEDTINVQNTIERLDELARRVRTVARPGARVLLGTGHPTGLLAVHIELARWLRQSGAVVLRPEARWEEPEPSGRVRDRHVRYLAGVAVVTRGANLLHTHSPEPMRHMLAALADAGEPPPDLVIADHGFAGAAGAAGVPVVGFADSNDPALFVGEAEGLIEVCVPLDDNVPPHLYEPLSDYLLERLRNGS
ncbi:conserved hypothetical protein [Acidothermus cellulolyticus 11B]|uniref:Phosphatase n=1 Tax=Acidothermus cellulolyticus (strain ATCC 43068 / DSM 8971 / 11B) TaxID=351607 RepID=A0LRF9_ACIC1|nr:phosphatase [Acidothermus cellulolyticus]ABK52019.1 conserved hypothetical protein [Acidothermus cellulolyticus 11B]MBX5447568.1 phosphatase [Acidothermus cellulolyticus]MCL6550494.1 phosphatase [Acidothermus cellulolyticus]